jgi:hypothetical protein
LKKKIVASLKYAGLAGVPVYIGFTLTAHLHNPSMGPFKNWLSDYGSPLINPSGAVFYNIGCVITAVLLAAFYIGMTSWHDGAPRKLVVCYTGAQASGLVAAVFLVLASIVPIGTSPAHETFSMINMIGMDSFLVFTAIAAFMNPYVSSGLGVLGFIAAAFNIFTTNVIGNFFIAEWVFFAMFIVYVVLLTVMYERFRGENIRAAQENAASLAE